MNETKRGLGVGKRNYIPGSMSFAAGFMGPPISARDKPLMLVDEAKAKELIEDRLSAGRKIERVQLGLDGDWEQNNTVVYDDGGFHEYDSYTRSCWATPTLIIYYYDEPNEAIECYKEENECQTN